MSAETARQEARRLPVWPIEPRQKLVNPYGRLWRIHTAWAAGLAPEQAKRRRRLDAASARRLVYLVETYWATWRWKPLPLAATIRLSPAKAVTRRQLHHARGNLLTFSERLRLVYEPRL